MAAFAIVKVDDAFNFYSSFRPELASPSGEPFEYRVAEVVGWKGAQQKLTLRAGPGAFWGFGGYVDLDLERHAHYLDSFYSVVLPENTRNIRSAEQ